VKKSPMGLEGSKTPPVQTTQLRNLVTKVKWKGPLEGRLKRVPRSDRRLLQIKKLSKIEKQRLQTPDGGGRGESQKERAQGCVGPGGKVLRRQKKVGTAEQRKCDGPPTKSEGEGGTRG